MFWVVFTSCVGAAVAESYSLTQYIAQYGDQMSPLQAVTMLDARGYNASAVVSEAHGVAALDRSRRGAVVDKLKKYLNGKMKDADKSRLITRDKLMQIRREWHAARKAHQTIIDAKYACWISNEKAFHFHLLRQLYFEGQIARNAKRQAEELAKFMVIKKALDKEIKANMDMKDAYAWGLRNAVPDCNKMAGLMLMCSNGRVEVQQGLNSTDAMKVRKLLVMHSHKHEFVDADEDDDSDDDDVIVAGLKNAAGDDEEFEDASVAVEEGLVASEDEAFIAGSAFSFIQQPDMDDANVQESDPVAPPTVLAKKKRRFWKDLWRRGKAIFRRVAAAINAALQRKKAEQRDKKRAAEALKIGEEKRKKKEEGVRKFGQALDAAVSDFDCLWLGNAAKNLSKLNLANADTPCTKGAKKAAEKIFKTYEPFGLSNGQMYSMLYKWIKSKFSADQKQFLRDFGVPKSDVDVCKTTKETCEQFADSFELERKNFEKIELDFRQQLAIALAKYNKIKARLLQTAKVLNENLVKHKALKVKHKNIWDGCQADWTKQMKLLADARKEWHRTENENSKIIRDKMKEYCGLLSTLNNVEAILKLAVTLPCKQGPWTASAPCTVTCGTGSRAWERKTLQEPQNGGAPCGASEKAEICNVNKCPIDCKLGEWAGWSKCKRLGAGAQDGVRKRHRSFTLPRHGGRKCTQPEYLEEQKCTPPKPPLQWRAMHGNSNHGRIYAHRTRHMNSYFDKRNTNYAFSLNTIAGLAAKFLKLGGRFNVSPCRGHCKRRFWMQRNHCNRWDKMGGIFRRLWAMAMKARCYVRAGLRFAHCLVRCRPCARENVAHYLGMPSGKFSMYRMFFRARWNAPSMHMQRKCGAIKGGLNRMRYVHMLYPLRLFSWSESFTIPNWRDCSGERACECPQGSFIGGMYTGLKNYNRDGWDNIKIFRCVMYTGGVDAGSVSCEWDVNTPSQVRVWAPQMQEVRSNVAGRRKRTWFALGGFKTSGKLCKAGPQFMDMGCIKEVKWCSLPQWQQ